MEVVPSVRSSTNFPMGFRTGRSFTVTVLPKPGSLIFSLSYAFPLRLTRHQKLIILLRPAVCYRYPWCCGNRPRVRIQFTRNRCKAAFIQQAKNPSLCELARSIGNSNASCHAYYTSQPRLGAHYQITEAELNGLASIFVQQTGEWEVDGRFDIVYRRRKGL